jgi:hypothetical protein
MTKGPLTSTVSRCVFISKFLKLPIPEQETFSLVEKKGKCMPMVTAVDNIRNERCSGCSAIIYNDIIFTTTFKCRRNHFYHSLCIGDNEINCPRCQIPLGIDYLSAAIFQGIGRLANIPHIDQPFDPARAFTTGCFVSYIFTTLNVQHIIMKEFIKSQVNFISNIQFRSFTIDDFDENGIYRYGERLSNLNMELRTNVPSYLKYLVERFPTSIKITLNPSYYYRSSTYLPHFYTDDEIKIRIERINLIADVVSDRKKLITIIAVNGL